MVEPETFPFSVIAGNEHRIHFSLAFHPAACMCRIVENHTLLTSPYSILEYPTYSYWRVYWF